MGSISASLWETKRTDESRHVEFVLRAAGFAKVDAYRYNAASLRVRVIDSRFERLDRAERDAIVELHLVRAPECIGAEIVNFFTFAPSEFEEGSQLSRTHPLNAEFEDPSPSLL